MTPAYQSAPQADTDSPAWVFLLIRILWIVLLLTLGVLTIFAGLMAHLVSGITTKVHEEIQRPTLVLSEPLPDAATLRRSSVYELAATSA